jgi:AraC-like DNA-binding protein
MAGIEHFSTRQVAAGRKIEFWNELLAETYSGLVVDPLQPRFDAQMSRWLLGDMTMIWPKSAAAAVARRRNGPTPANQTLVLHMLHAGECHLTHRGRESVLRAGDMVVCTGEEYYRFDVGGHHEMLVVEMSRSLAAERVAGLDDRIGCCISGQQAATRLLHNYLLSLWREGAANLDEAMGQAYSTVLVDLFAMSLRAPDTSAPASRSPLFDRMKGVVEARLGDPALTPSSLAGELGVSLRTLQGAAADAGTTPVGYIARRRLEMAAQKLRMDPKASITQIAFDVGFTDGAYFTRRFHDQFGVSPRQYRLQH